MSKMNFYVAVLDERNGEFAYSHLVKFALTSRRSPKKHLKDIAKSWYGGNAEAEDDGFYFFGGQIFVSPGEIYPVSEAIFAGVKEFIHTL